MWPAVAEGAPAVEPAEAEDSGAVDLAAVEMAVEASAEAAGCSADIRRSSRLREAPDRCRPDAPVARSPRS